jgi:O-methyltransferase
MLERFFRNLLRPMGLHVMDRRERTSDMDPKALEIMAMVKPYTMTSPERQFSLIEAVRHVERATIPGDIVECGVWRGGGMMAAAYTLMSLGAKRYLHLFDTFEGMSAPTEHDVDWSGQSAAPQFERTKQGSGSAWCDASIEDVQQNIARTGYDARLVNFVKGKVEDTIPASAPAQIALLRLDTDWYESTSHELVHLYPRLAPGGVLIIDDYGFWQGSRRATDEYFESNKPRPFLGRIDSTARIAIKP